MHLTSILICCLVTAPYHIASAVDCVNVATSEGLTTLKHGEKACDALKSGETDADKGKRFITCSHGTVLVQACSPGLVFDTLSGSCTWPAAATCDLNPSTPTPASGGPTVSWTGTPIPLPIEPCDSTNCQIPDCFCYGDSPANISDADLPMFVMLSFDDAITASFYHSYYYHILINNTYDLKNPNGCPVKAAFYVSHENTDYRLLKVLRDAGNEIASHTIHHILAEGDKDSDYGNMTAEIDGFRKIVFAETGDQALADSLVGFRAPFLRVAGDVMFQVLSDYEFLYDSSIVNVESFSGRPPLWPYTLDYRVKSCVNPPCPTRSFPGLWEVPLNGWVGDDGYSCGMIDGCTVGENLYTANETEWYNYYKRNFEEYFYKNKVPMHMFTHASMLLRNTESWPSLIQWLQDMLSTYDDVWMVSPKQVIEWMQNPLTRDEMVAQKWAC